MSVEAFCMTDHAATGGVAPGAIIQTFESMQEASNRGLSESYPQCSIQYRLTPTESEKETN